MKHMTCEPPSVNGRAAREMPDDLRQLVRDLRSRIALFYQKYDDAGALMAVACAAIRLEGFIRAGVVDRKVRHQINEVASNLGLRRRLGDRVVDTALSAGLTIYDALEDAEARTLDLRASRRRTVLSRRIAVENRARPVAAVAA